MAAGHATSLFLVISVAQLARREEQEVRAEFGEEYDRYAAVTPAFPRPWAVPNRRKSRPDRDRAAS